MNVVERAQLLTQSLKSNGRNRPKKRRALESQIQAIFGKALSPAEVAQNIDCLLQDGILTLSNKGDVRYPR